MLSELMKRSQTYKTMSQDQRALNTFGFLTQTIKALVHRMKAIRMLFSNLNEPRAANYDFQCRVMQLVECTKRSAQCELDSNIHCKRVNKLFNL